MPGLGGGNRVASIGEQFRSASSRFVVRVYLGIKDIVDIFLDFDIVGLENLGEFGRSEGVDHRGIKISAVVVDKFVVNESSPYVVRVDVVESVEIDEILAGSNGIQIVDLRRVGGEVLDVFHELGVQIGVQVVHLYLVDCDILIRSVNCKVLYYHGFNQSLCVLVY